MKKLLKVLGIYPRFSVADKNRRERCAHLWQRSGVREDGQARHVCSWCGAARHRMEKEGD